MSPGVVTGPRLRRSLSQEIGCGRHVDLESEASPYRVKLEVRPDGL